MATIFDPEEVAWYTQYQPEELAELIAQWEDDIKRGQYSPEPSEVATFREAKDWLKRQSTRSVTRVHCEGCQEVATPVTWLVVDWDERDIEIMGAFCRPCAERREQ